MAPKLEWHLIIRAKVDCWNVAVSGDGCTYFHVCIQSVVRGFHVYKAVWTSVGVKKLLINFWDISLAAKLQKNHVGSN